MNKIKIRLSLMKNSTLLKKKRSGSSLVKLVSVFPVLVGIGVIWFNILFIITFLYCTNFNFETENI